MNRVTVRHIDVVRAANIVAVLYAVAVVVIGLLVFVPLGLIGGVATIGMGEGNAGMALGAGVLGLLVMLVLGVVMYGVIGWITTAIAVWLYNLVAARIGGLRFIADVEGPSPFGQPGGPGSGYGAPVSYAAPPVATTTDGPPAPPR